MRRSSRRNASKPPSNTSAGIDSAPPPPECAATVTLITVTASTAEALALPPGPVQVSMYVSVPATLGETVRLPDVACVPLHAPLAMQELALLLDQVSVALLPTAIEEGFTPIVTVGDGVGDVTTLNDFEALAGANW
jgi:hypothetical protein